MALSAQNLLQLKIAQQRISQGRGTPSDRAAIAAARRLGWKPPAPKVIPVTTAEKELTPEEEVAKLAASLTPTPVGETELSTRFGNLYDLTFAGQESDLGKEIGTRTSRFGEDSQIATERRIRDRALRRGQEQESQASRGVSGQLGEQQLQRQVQRYDDADQDTGLMSSRFSTDIADEQQKRLRDIRQRKAQARAAYLADPNNRYEFSY